MMLTGNFISFKGTNYYAEDFEKYFDLVDYVLNNITSQFDSMDELEYTNEYKLFNKYNKYNQME